MLSALNHKTLNRSIVSLKHPYRWLAPPDHKLDTKEEPLGTVTADNQQK
jgi:hypothetical protein